MKEFFELLRTFRKTYIDANNLSILNDTVYVEFNADYQGSGRLVEYSYDEGVNGNIFEFEKHEELTEYMKDFIKENSESEYKPKTPPIESRVFKLEKQVRLLMESNNLTIK